MTEADPGPDPGTLARYLRQRSELGSAPLVLRGLDRGSAVQAARALGRGERSGAASDDETGGGPELPVLPADYEGLRAEALSCTRCRLHQTRTRVVFSDGPREARLMVIGEAPGANEDRTGRPFVGAAGKLLDLILASVSLSRETNVYICNVIKCRPPGNRDPQADEIETCTPFLRRQIEHVAPEAILAVGTFAARWVTGSRSALGKIRGTVYSYQGVPTVVTYHPAALLRNSGWNRPTWDDLQLLRTVLDGG